jgi:iron complex outermembrane recepter protein
VGGRADWSTQGRDSFTLQGDMYKGYEGERKNIAFYSPPSQANIDANTRVSGGNLLGRWRRDLGDDSDLQLQIYFDRTNRQGVQFGETRNTFDIDFIHHVTLARHQNFIWGLGARWSPSYFIQTQQTVDFLPHRQTDNIYSGFVQDEIPIVQNRFSVTVGTKLEHNNFSGFEYQPSVRLLWTPTQRQTFWASITRAVRTPSRLDDDIVLTGLLQSNPPVFVRIVGNSAFASESLIGYEAGYRNLLTHQVYIDLNWFHNSYDNLSSFGVFSMFPETTPSPPHMVLSVPFVNGVRGSTDGFEVGPDWKPISWWQLKGSYAFLTMDLGGKPGVPGTSIASSYEGSSPHHQIVIQSLFNLPKGLEFDQTYRYVSALPKVPLVAYETADARVSWRPTARFELSLIGQNLLQPSHAEAPGDPGPLIGIKRSFYAKITFQNAR